MQEISPGDIKRIVDLIHSQHGYDFSNYAMSSFRRRLLRMMELKRITAHALMVRLNNEDGFVNEFLKELTVNVTEMFRDNGFWSVLRTDILPRIAAARRPVKIWHAGCSTGEEVFSMAILLREMGISDEATLVATDLDLTVLEKARAGRYPLKNMELNEKNYLRFGGKQSSLAGYFTVSGNHVQFDTDLVRSVMIYFNQALQNEVLKKFHKSIFNRGYLAIGSKESLIWCDISNKFSVVNTEEKIYQKIKE